SHFKMRGDPRSWAIHLRLHALRGDLDLGPAREKIAAGDVYPAPSLMAELIRVGAYEVSDRYRAAFRDSSRLMETWAEGLLRVGRAEWVEAETALNTVLEEYRRIGSLYNEADLMTWLGRCAIGFGDHELARERLTSARELWASMSADGRITEIDEML